MGSGRRPDGGGGRRRSPRKLIDLSILHIYRVFFLVRNDPLFNYLSMSFTPQFMKYDSISTLLQYCSTLCSKSPSVRGFVVSLPVRLLFKYLPPQYILSGFVIAAMRHLRPIIFRTCRYFTGLCSSNASLGIFSILLS